jgi:hypothetical protein
MNGAQQETLDWLARRQPPPPFDLERRLMRAVERTQSSATSVADVLADAALESLTSAARAGADRTAANDLLTADALLTYAVEAAAEKGGDRLDALLARLNLSRFDDLLNAHERR